MVDVMVVASYIYNRYKELKKVEIDEMKLHKLMYFSQRESYIIRHEPLFNATFYGWKYGPVLKEIRTAYKDKTFFSSFSEEDLDVMKPIIDSVFEKYAEKDSWRLSDLTHGEISWQNARIGIPENVNGDREMKLADIQKDAERIIERTKMLENFGLI